MRVLCIKWVDARMSNNEWVLRDDLEIGHGLTECISYGWAVREASDHILLAGTRANSARDDEQFTGLMTIPRICIVDITVLVP